MPENRFFKPKKEITLKEIAEISGCEILNKANSDMIISNVASLEKGKEHDISFLESKKMLNAFNASKVGACIVNKDINIEKTDKTLLSSANPYEAFVKIANYFYPVERQKNVSEKAFIDSSAKIGKDCSIETGAVIEAGVEIGDNSFVGANTVIRKNVVIGNDCFIDANVTISHAVIGNRVTLYPGVRIGQDGFGYIMSRNGHTKVPQLGQVIIGDDVDIGANSTVDRGALDDTVIGNGCKIDNFVQVAHNVKLGFGCVLAAQVGISGSSTLGNLVAAGGQAGLADHLNVGDGANLAAKSGVMRDVKAGETVMGYPAFPMREYMRQIAYLQKASRRK